MSTVIEVLNDVSRGLIDSRKGYQHMIDACNDDFVLKSQFKLRMNDRTSIIRKFHNEIIALGGKPEQSGSLQGAVLRGFTEFKSLFQDDEKAALDAIEDTEEELAEYIESKLAGDDLTHKARSLLNEALVSAKSGERFADSLDD